MHTYIHTYIYIHTYMFVSVWQGAISFSSSSHFYTFLMYVLNCIVLCCFYSSFDFICIYWMVCFYTIFFKGTENIIILMIFIYLVTCYIVRNIVQACKMDKDEVLDKLCVLFFFFFDERCKLERVSRTSRFQQRCQTL